MAPDGEGSFNAAGPGWFAVVRPRREGLYEAWFVSEAGEVVWPGPDRDGVLARNCKRWVRLAVAEAEGWWPRMRGVPGASRMIWETDGPNMRVASGKGWAAVVRPGEAGYEAELSLTSGDVWIWPDPSDPLAGSKTVVGCQRWVKSAAARLGQGLEIHSGWKLSRHQEGQKGARLPPAADTN